MKKLFVSPNPKLTNANDCTRAVVSRLCRLGLSPVITADLAPMFPSLGGIEVMDRQQALDSCDALIAIGGDGTIFHSAIDALMADIPVLGINCGRLGFLSQMDATDLSKLSRLVSGDYSVESRMVLQATICHDRGSESRLAVNDVVLSRASSNRIIDIDLTCSERMVGRYRADGIIFATPTGSTAYSLSAGGPIVDPGIDTILVTPVCPHSLYNRSIVFSPENVLCASLATPDKDDELLVTADGQTLCPQSQVRRVEISRSKYVSKFISFYDIDFYQTLNQKLSLRG